MFAKHASLAHVGHGVHPRNLAFVSPDVVEDDPLAQREVAERDVLGAEPLQDGVDQDGSGDHEIRLLREVLDPKSLYL